MAGARYDKTSSMKGMTPFERPGSDIKKMGYLKKLKTNKKKYFVLRSTSSSGPARLEYYDSERKFSHGQLPKRSIQLHTLLNINKKLDSKHKNAIALYTKDDCFSIMADDEAEQEDWYQLLLDYQCEYLREDDTRREHFEHLWQVTIQQKGLGNDRKLRGNYRLCLSRTCLSLVRVNSEKPQVTFQLATVRSLAHNDNLFRMEVGSWAPTGAGELWMHVEDSVIAQSMHEAILSCMKAATNSTSMDESDSGRFEKRADTNAYRTRGHTTDFRPRTVSESHTQSPRRLRPKLDEPPRPVSIVYPSSRSVSLPADTISPGTSPHMPFDLMHGHRFRSDSSESRASRSSMHTSATDDLSPSEFPMGPSYMDHSPQVIDEEDDYLEHEIGSHDFTSVSSSPGESKTPIDEDGNSSQYMDMQPTNTTPPMGRNAGASGYVPMSIGQQAAAAHESISSTTEGAAYMSMNTGRIASEPIPIKSSPGTVGYMDMSHSSHLPTVREGSSNEGYLPMTPNSGQSSFDASHLRPDPAVCMLSEDSSEIHRRTYSLGSRPPTKTTSRIPNIHDPVPIKRGIMDNDGRSSSAPHLITNRGRSLNVESPTPSASPLSMSFKSESSYRSDDSDSFMELDFHRPRTASDSHSYRPRASSFGKTAMQSLQGHRPRSSSYGQGVRTFKLRNGARIASHESIRTTSIDSLSHRSSRDSLRVSSSESLRKLSEELRTKTNLLNTDYIDMSMDKRKTPSPQPPNRRENGYMDMTLGSRTTSPSRSKSSHDSGTTSKSQSSEMLHVNQDQNYINVETPEMTSMTSSGSSYINYDHPDQSHHRHHPTPIQGHARGDAGKGDRHSKVVSEDMYVMYEPSSKGAAHSKEEHQSSRKPGSTDSLKKKSRHEKSRSSREHRHKSSSSSSKRKSNIEEYRDVHITKLPQPSNVGKRDSNIPMDEYIEFSPSMKLGSAAAPKTEAVIVESEYIGYQPGSQSQSSASTISKPQAVKSFFSTATKQDKTKLASGSSRVPESGLTSSSSSSSKFCRTPESDYVLSSPIQSGSSGSKTGAGDTSDYVLSSPIKGGSNMPKSGAGDASDYVLSSPIQGSSNRPKSGAGDASDYVLSSPISSTSSVGKPAASYGGKPPGRMVADRVSSPIVDTSKRVDTSDYVLSSPIGSSTPVSTKPSHPFLGSPSSKTSKDESDYVLASPANVAPQYKSDRDRKVSPLSVKIPKKVSSVPTDNLRGGHEGTSVDPSPHTATSISPSERPSEVAKPGEGLADKPKLQSVANVRSPQGDRRERKTSRTKHLSGNAGTTQPTREVTENPEDGGSSALSRPGSTPCMLTLDESKSKPALSGTSLKVDATARGRHSISDLSAYEQMTFPSNTLSTSSSSQLSTSSTLSQQQSGSEKVLNYASLDLGSSETVSEGNSSTRSPRIKSRHSSAADEKGEPPLSYAQIDFEKSESLKSAPEKNKDVKFTL